MAQAMKIAIVDDEQDMRQSISQWLALSGYDTETFASAEEALKTLGPEYPGIVISDIKMPGMGGMQVLKKRMGSDSALPVIMITGHGDVPMAVEAMRVGAFDFLEKPFDDEVLLPLVENALAHSASLFESQQQQLQIQELHDSLSRREKQVMNLVVAGRANREIAEELGISPKTVEVHRSRVMSKMRAGSLPELVKQAEQLGLS